MNVATVRDLLRVPFNALRYLKGAGLRTRKEISTLTHDLHRANPDFDIKESDEIEQNKIVGPKYASLDGLLREIDRTGKAEAKPLLHVFLGIEQKENLPFWPGQKEVAAVFEFKDDAVARIIKQARNSWRRLPAVTRLRDDIATIIAKHGGLISAPDLATAVLTVRGSTLEEPKRTQFAAAVCRAAIEAEQGIQKRRFFVHRNKNGILVINNMELAAYSAKLGETADRLASHEPLAPPLKVIENLRAIEPPQGMPPVPKNNDLLKIAVYASSKAALSTRLEIYPKSMSALRMLRLSQGTLAGVRELTVQEIHQRVTGRYAQGEDLPNRPELDNLLTQAGLDMAWQSSAAQGQGAFCYRDIEFTIDTSGSSISHPSTIGAPVNLW